MTVRTRNIMDASITSTALDVDVFSLPAHVAADAVDSRSIDAGAIGTAEIASSTFKTGYIPLDITTARVLSGGDVIINTTEGGWPDGDLTDPTLDRINGATDKAIRLVWNATKVEEIMFAPFALPPDIDSGAALTVNIRANVEAGGDTPVLTVSYFEGVGDTNAGGNTTALATTMASKQVSIAHGAVGAAGAPVTISLLPAAHAAQAVYVYAVWVEYTRIGVGA